MYTLNQIEVNLRISALEADLVQHYTAHLSIKKKLRKMSLENYIKICTTAHKIRMHPPL